MDEIIKEIEAEIKATRQKLAVILARGNGRYMTLNDSMRIDNQLNYMLGLRFCLERLQKEQDEKVK